MMNARPPARRRGGAKREAGPPSAVLRNAAEDVASRVPERAKASGPRPDTILLGAGMRHLPSPLHRRPRAMRITIPHENGLSKMRRTL